MLKNIRLAPTLYILYILSMVLLLLTHDPVIAADTASYVNFSVNRPLLYPIFIWLFKWCGIYQFAAITWAKTIIYGMSLVYARMWLRRHLNLSDFLIFLLFCFTTITTFRFALLSESLTVPIFIMAFFSAVEFVTIFQLKKVIWFAVWTTLLILTRTQFYYFYLLYILIIFICWQQKQAYKNLMLVSVVLLSSIVLTILFNTVYAYFVRGQHDCNISLGNQLIVQPLYMADMNVTDYFNNFTQKKYVSSVLTQMKKEKLSYNDTPTNPVYLQDIYAYYGFNYNAIQRITCSSIKNVLLSESEQSRFLIDVSKILYLHDIKKNLVLYTWKFVEFFGGLPVFFGFLIILAAVGSGLISNKGTRFSIEQAFVTVGIIILFLNNSLVALVETYITRYFFYNYFIYYCFAILAADRLFFR